MPNTPVNTANTQRDLGIIALTMMTLALAWLIYQPGMGGVFLLDDIPNLSPLNKFNTAPSPQAALQFIESGRSGPLGRPLSMASFLLDAADWPDNAGRFRQTNLLLHLINGLLLLAVMLRLAPYLGRHGHWVAALTTSLWLIHPMHTSTTLYVVQRMVLLSSAFILSGAWIYLIGRARLVRGEVIQGGIIMAAGISLGTGLGILAKENATLLPVILLGLELSLLPKYSLDRFPRLRTSHLSLLTLPLLAIITYVLLAWPDFSSGYKMRALSPVERLMTEARILLDYLSTLVAPRASDMSIFYDGYQKSTGLLDPPSTLVALTVLLVAILASAYYRRVAPVLAGGLFWFLSNHLLESSVLPLELYFQHRNYLASIGILWIIVYLLISIPIASHRLKQTAAGALAFILVVLFSTQTYTAAMSYGDPLQAAIVWPEEQPQSSRVRQFAVKIWLQYGNYPNAEKQMAAATTHHPMDTMLWLELAQMQCAQQKNTAVAVQKAITTASSAPLNKGMLDTFDYLRDMIKTKRCETLSPSGLLSVTRLLLKNPRYAARDDKARLWYIRGQLLADQGQFEKAVQAIENAKTYRPDLAIRFWQYTWLLNAGQRDSASTFLEKSRHEASANSATKAIKNDFQNILNISLRLSQLTNSTQTTIDATLDATFD